MKNSRKGFTLIELMVVIVIIGILAALAIPKMIGVSAKSKASEAPTTIANYETLQSAYVQETGVEGNPANTGFMASTSNWWTYTATTVGTITAGVGGSMAVTSIGDCLSSANPILTSNYDPVGDSAVHSMAGATTCQAYFPNY